MEMMFVTPSLLSLLVWFTPDSTLSTSLLFRDYSSFIRCVLSVCDWPLTQPSLRDSERPPKCPASTGQCSPRLNAKVFFLFFDYHHPQSQTRGWQTMAQIGINLATDLFACFKSILFNYGKIFVTYSLSSYLFLSVQRAAPEQEQWVQVVSSPRSRTGLPWSTDLMCL